MLPIPNFLGNIIILSSILLARYVNSSDAVNVSCHWIGHIKNRVSGAGSPEVVTGQVYFTCGSARPALVLLSPVQKVTDGTSH